MSIAYGTSGGKEFWDIRGKSSDEKPIDGVPNCSSFFEMDTGEVYIFDEDTKSWLIQ